MNLPENYIPILIQAAVGLGFVAISLLGAHFLGPKQKKGNSVKNSSWECGIPRRKCQNTIFHQIFLNSGIVRVVRYRNRIFLSLCC